MGYRQVIGLSVPIILLLTQLVSAQPQCPTGRTYTTDLDFQLGAFSNVTPGPGSGQLQLERVPAPMYPYLNVACSGRGTIVRIDVGNGTTEPRIIGEYRTAPAGYGGSPSRTTVDRRGSVWVSNRRENSLSSAGCDAELDPSGKKGSIARIALIVGGKRVNAASQEDPDGEYIVDAPEEDKPITYCSVGPGPNGDWRVLDTRPTDNRIRTSPGAGNDKLLAWSNTNGADTHGGVSTAEDELIINYTRVTATGTRALAVDNDNDLWVGGEGWTGPQQQDHGNYEHQKVSGETGECIPGTQFNMQCGGYGALMDHTGVLWSADY